MIVIIEIHNNILGILLLIVVQIVKTGNWYIICIKRCTYKYTRFFCIHGQKYFSHPCIHVWLTLRDDQYNHNKRERCRILLILHRNTHYSYPNHNNVKTLISWINELNISQQSITSAPIWTSPIIWHPLDVVAILQIYLLLWILDVFWCVTLMSTHQYQDTHMLLTPTLLHPTIQFLFNYSFHFRVKMENTRTAATFCLGFNVPGWYCCYNKRDLLGHALIFVTEEAESRRKAIYTNDWPEQFVFDCTLLRTLQEKVNPCNK